MSSSSILCFLGEKNYENLSELLVIWLKLIYYLFLNICDSDRYWKGVFENQQ